MPENNESSTWTPSGDFCSTPTWNETGRFPLLFTVLFLCIGSLGWIFPNATAITMQPFAAEAGTASALLGIFQFILGAAGGALVGAFYNGTALPMALQITCYGLAARGTLLLSPTQSPERPLP